MWCRPSANAEVSAASQSTLIVRGMPPLSTARRASASGGKRARSRAFPCSTGARLRVLEPRAYVRGALVRRERPEPGGDRDAGAERLVAGCRQTALQLGLACQHDLERGAAVLANQIQERGQGLERRIVQRLGL